MHRRTIKYLVSWHQTQDQRSGVGFHNRFYRKIKNWSSAITKLAVVLFPAVFCLFWWSAVTLWKYRVYYDVNVWYGNCSLTVCVFLGPDVHIQNSMQIWPNQNMMVMVKVILTLEVLVVTIGAQWEGMGDVGSVRYEPALLSPCPTIRVLTFKLQ